MPPLDWAELVLITFLPFKEKLQTFTFGARCFWRVSNIELPRNWEFLGLSVGLVSSCWAMFSPVLAGWFKSLNAVEGQKPRANYPGSGFRVWFHQWGRLCERGHWGRLRYALSLAQTVLGQIGSLPSLSLVPLSLHTRWQGSVLVLSKSAFPSSGLSDQVECWQRRHCTGF